MARTKTTDEEERDTLEKLAGIGEKRANRKTYGKEKALCPALPSQAEARRRSWLRRASKRA